MEAETKKESVKKRLASLEKRRRNSLRKHTNERTATAAQELGAAAATDSWLASRGASKWGGRDEEGMHHPQLGAD